MSTSNLSALVASLIGAFVLGLASQTAHAQEWDKSVGFDVRHYRFEITLSDISNEIAGLATVEIELDSPETTEVHFDLSDSMAVHSVTVDGRSAEFAHDGNRLAIELPASRDRSHRITIAYSGVPADGLIIGSNKHGERVFFADNWPNRAHNWLPVVDHPAEKATVDWIVDAPAYYQVVANGSLIEETDLSDERRRTHWRTEEPLSPKVMVIGVARFAVQHLADVGEVPVQSWVYPSDRNSGFYDFAVAPGVLTQFVHLFGEYPWAKLANVQSTTRYGGMENASAIFYHQDRITGRRSNQVTVAHEIAHQWFGNSVTECDWPHLWLSEGFASYAAAYYVESALGKDFTLEFLGRRQTRITEFDEEAPELPVVDTLTTDPNDRLNPNTYQKGAYVLRMLQREIGDERFFRSLQRYHRQFRGGTACTDDFVTIAEMVSGRELGWFFQQWLYRPDEPRVTANWRYDDATRSLNVRVAQQSRGRPFQFPLDLLIEFAQSPDSSVAVQVDRDVHEFEFKVDHKPVRIKADPDRWLVSQVNVSKL